MVLLSSEASRGVPRWRRLGVLLSVLSVVVLSAALWTLIVLGLRRLLG